MIIIGVGANSQAQKGDFSAALIEVRRNVRDAAIVATFDTASFVNHVRDAARDAAFEYLPMTLETMRARNGDCLTHSERSLSLFGVASVAEAAALAGAGPGSRLIMPRRIIGHITVAAAQSADEGEQSE